MRVSIAFLQGSVRVFNQGLLVVPNVESVLGFPIVVS